jgi:hypothetical protein
MNGSLELHMEGVGDDNDSAKPEVGNREKPHRRYYPLKGKTNSNEHDNTGANERRFE